jgi:type II secretory pathway pseudopilin PulG
VLSNFSAKTQKQPEAYKSSYQSSGCFNSTSFGFSLVEVVLAIGIFSFVAVAILGLLSVGLKLRADSSLETRATIIAEELLSSISMSGGLTQAMFRDGPALQIRNNQSVDLTRQKVLIGYVGGTTVPLGLWHSARGQDPQGVWDKGVTDSWAIANGIETIALVSASPAASGLNSGLYQVFVNVRTPASLPASISKSQTFSTFMYRQ